jgi:hypothetical protein
LEVPQETGTTLYPTRTSQHHPLSPTQHRKPHQHHLKIAIACVMQQYLWQPVLQALLPVLP